MTIESEAEKGKTEVDERVQKDIVHRAVREAVAKVVAVAAVAVQKETKPKQAPEATGQGQSPHNRGWRSQPPLVSSFTPTIRRSWYL